MHNLLQPDENNAQASIYWIEREKTKAFSGEGTFFEIQSIQYIIVEIVNTIGEEDKNLAAVNVTDGQSEHLKLFNKVGTRTQLSGPHDYSHAVSMYSVSENF